MKLTIYPEICCEICNEVIHNHMDCPVCNTKYSDTNMYCNIWDLDIGEILECEKCKAKFELINNDGFMSQFEWELIT